MSSLRFGKDGDKLEELKYTWKLEKNALKLKPLILKYEDEVVILTIKRRDSTGCEVLNAVHWSIEELPELFLLVSFC